MRHNEYIKQVVEGIHKRANDIILKGGGDGELLDSLKDAIGDIRQVMEASTHQELDGYCKKYDGFCRYARLLQTLAQGIMEELTPVPK